MTSLQQEFDDALIQAVREGEKLNYSAGIFLEMRAKYGSVEEQTHERTRAAL